MARGSVLVDVDPELARAIGVGIRSVMARRRIRALIVQPPAAHPGLVPTRDGWGFRPAPAGVEIAPEASLRIDLTRPFDDLMADMRSGTRPAELPTPPFCHLGWPLERPT